MKNLFVLSCVICFLFGCDSTPNSSKAREIKIWEDHPRFEEALRLARSGAPASTENVAFLIKGLTSELRNHYYGLDGLSEKEIKIDLDKIQEVLRSECVDITYQEESLQYPIDTGFISEFSTPEGAQEYYFVFNSYHPIFVSTREAPFSYESTRAWRGGKITVKDGKVGVYLHL